jgi:hypothetical protein
MRAGLEGITLGRPNSARHIYGSNVLSFSIFEEDKIGVP